MVVFVILAVFTVMETGVAYLPHLPEGVRIGVLGFLAATKVSLVLLYFMHLRSDYRIFALPFALGLVLVVPLLLIVGLTTGEVSAPSATTATPTPGASAASSSGGQASQSQLVAEGKQLFGQNCAMCHDGQSGVGPPFSGMIDRADTRVQGESAQQYIHQSIVDPSAYVVPGYPDVMPKDFAQKFSSDQISALVAYITADSGDG
jgi:cytochrome c5